MKWFTETVINLTPLSLAVLLFAAMCLGWIIYGLRGYRYWWRRFHRYRTVPSWRHAKQSHRYVEYIPEVTRRSIPTTPRPQKRAPQIIHKTSAPITRERFDAPDPEPIYSTKDDLQVIEGIGPKIEEILNSNGIYTWRELSQTPISNLKAILERAGKKFQMHDPSTWPKQAHMADSGAWDDLKAWQDNLFAGRK